MTDDTVEYRRRLTMIVTPAQASYLDEAKLLVMPFLDGGRDAFNADLEQAFAANYEAKTTLEGILMLLPASTSTEAVDHIRARLAQLEIAGAGLSRMMAAVGAAMVAPSLKKRGPVQ